jgi:peptidase E
MRQIIAMGGGSALEPETPALEQYILNQSGKPRPKICFLPTASGDADGYMLLFYKAYSLLDCQPSTLSLFHPPSANLEDYVLEKDVIYVGGGNTRNMLCLWREWGLDGILKKAYQAGVILAGVSAGANCWFEACTTDSVPGELRMMSCLGLLPGSFSPHYDGEAERRPTLHHLLKSGKIPSGLAADNNAGVHFVDEHLQQAICIQPGAQVYRVGLKDTDVIEEKLEMKQV